MLRTPKAVMRPLPARLAALACSLLLAACATHSLPSPAPLPAAAAATPPPAPPTQASARVPLLLVSIDALRASYLDRGETPQLAALARDGVRARWMRPSYPSLTFPNHYTLVTGLRPDRHGIVHNTMRDQLLGDFRVSDAESTRDPRWWAGGVPVWATAGQHGLRTAVYAWPGAIAPSQGVAPGVYVPYDEHDTPEHDTPEHETATVAQWLLQPAAQRPDFTALYLPTVDKAGHEYGPDAPQTDAALRQVDAALGRLFDALKAHGLYERMDIVVVSDHGMAPVAPAHVLAVEDMASVQEARVVSVGQVVGIAPNPGYEAVLARRLPGRHAHYRCWEKARLPVRWHYGSNPRIPPIVCQMDPGWDALPREETAARRALGHDRGSHGYDPALPSMRAVFIAHGPSFRKGAVLPPFDNVAVYPLLMSLLDLPAQPGDGTLSTLAPALATPPPAP